MSNAPFKSLLFLGFLIGIAALQVFLSKKPNKQLGLILPSVNFIFSVIAVMGMTFRGKVPIIQTVTQVAFIFLACNVPTVLLLAIYFACNNGNSNSKRSGSGSGSGRGRGSGSGRGSGRGLGSNKIDIRKKKNNNLIDRIIDKLGL